jgi:hypothetical protein
MRNWLVATKNLISPRICQPRRIKSKKLSPGHERIFADADSAGYHDHGQSASKKGRSPKIYLLQQ